MQQRGKNDVLRQPREVHWDYVLDEAEWLRKDFREERVWKMREARKRAEACVQGWRLRVNESCHLVEDGEATRSRLGYRREGVRDGALKWRVYCEDEGGRRRN